MARLALHIGSKKTGTTLIQACLLQNVERLASLGWSTPDFTKNRNHAEFALPFQDRITDPHRHYEIGTPELAAAKLAELDRQLAKRVKPDSKWVISSEYFSTRLTTEEQIERAIAFLRPHFDQIDVYMIMRRQDYIMPSIYSQGVKEGFISDWSVERFERERPILDLAALTDRWSAVVGRDSFHAIPFLEAEKRDSAWLLNRFAQETGVPLDPSWVPQDQNFRNESLSIEGMAFLLLVDKYIPRWTADGVSNIGTRNRAVQRVIELTPGPSFKPRPQDLAEIEESYRESNLKLVAAMPRTDEWAAWLDQPQPPADPVAELPALTPERVAELMVGMSAPAGPLDWGRPGSKPLPFKAYVKQRVRTRMARGKKE